MLPSVGRIVHYTHESGEHLAAIITRIWILNPGAVNLVVFPDHSTMVGTPFAITEIQYGDDDTPDRWHWPEREGE